MFFNQLHRLTAQALSVVRQFVDKALVQGLKRNVAVAHWLAVVVAVKFAPESEFAVHRPHVFCVVQRVLLHGQHNTKRAVSIRTIIIYNTVPYSS